MCVRRGWTAAVGPSARSLISRATVLRPRRRRSVLRLVDAVGDLDGEPSSGPILIVTATGAVDSVDGEVVYGVPSRSRCTMNVVAVVPLTRPSSSHWSATISR